MNWSRRAWLCCPRRRPVSTLPLLSGTLMVIRWNWRKSSVHAIGRKRETKYLEGGRRRIYRHGDAHADDAFCSTHDGSEDGHCCQTRGDYPYRTGGGNPHAFPERHAHFSADLRVSALSPTPWRAMAKGAALGRDSVAWLGDSHDADDGWRHVRHRNGGHEAGHGRAYRALDLRRYFRSHRRSIGGR